MRSNFEPVHVLIVALALTLLIAGMLLLRNWFVSQVVAEATNPADTSGLFPTVVPILTTPLVGSGVQFQPWTPLWDQPTPTVEPSGGVYIVVPQR